VDHSIAGDAFDSRYLGAVVIGRQQKATGHRQTVYVDRTGPTIARITAAVRPHQVQFIPQNVKQGAAVIQV
jgi:hypothetical protein